MYARTISVIKGIPAIIDNLIPKITIEAPKRTIPIPDAIKNFKLVQRMYLIDSEGELSTRKIDLSFSQDNVKEVMSTFNWKSEKEFKVAYNEWKKMFDSAMKNNDYNY